MPTAIKSSVWKKVAWLVVIWAVSVLGLGLVAYAIRAVLHP